MGEEKQPRLKEVGPTLFSRERSGGLLDKVTNIMKNLQLSQVKVQNRLENKLAFLRYVFTKVPLPKTAHAPALYYPPCQYGYRVYHSN